MFLKRQRRRARGESYDYWSLVRSVQTARGPRHEVISRLGKLDGTEQKAARSWRDVDALLEGRPCAKQLEFGEDGTSTPRWQQVDVKRVRVERVRQFGRVYLGLVLWRRLKLHRHLKELLPRGREQIEWDLIGCILTLGRFCAQPSELSVAERWYEDTALEDLLGVPIEKINETRLYRGLDRLLEQKEALCAHLQEQYQSWFGVQYEFLLYDVTSTYFEGLAEGNELAARGYSRDHRPDCKQVCIGLIVTPEGLPVGYELFAGNRNDVTTLEEMVGLMEQKYGQAKRVWVFDRGIASEANLAWLRKRGAKYLVGTPKKQLRKFEAQLLEESDWTAIREGLEVKLVETPEGTERFVLCRSTDRAAKERGMLQRQWDRLGEQLHKIDASLRRNPTRQLGSVERRIGRWMGRYPAAAALFTVKIGYDAEQRASHLLVQEHSERYEWACRAHGAYLLRTNYVEGDQKALWKWYIQLSQAEAAFRTSKSDLNLRPVFHQVAERVQAHVLVCFLSLAMWRVLEQWMSAKGLGSCARQLLLELDELRSMDVVLPTKEDGEIRLRVAAKPEKPLAQLLVRLGIELPNAPKVLGNVVPKMT
jgi:transposase